MSFCTQCGYPMAQEDAFCVSCGAARELPYVPAVTGVNPPVQAVSLLPNWDPRTLDDMKRWYDACRFPPYRESHMFVGENSTIPSSLGVYFDGAAFVTYENDRTGGRRIRVRGTEEQAVAEFYRKFRPIAEKTLARMAQMARR